MQKIRLSVNFRTQFGQCIFVCGTPPEMGKGEEQYALEMRYISPEEWAIDIELDCARSISYYYFVKENGSIIRKEWGTHIVHITNNKTYIIKDFWQEIPSQRYFYTSAFTDSFFKQQNLPNVNVSINCTLIFNVYCPYVKQNQKLILCGSGSLGEWKVLHENFLTSSRQVIWQLTLDYSQIKNREEYKFAIWSESEKKIIHWEECENHILDVSANINDNVIQVQSHLYFHSAMYWRTAGVAIPVFSLRSEDSFGTGEFSDLHKLIDWGANSGLRVIQLLPVNDTTVTGKWTDSYPYNAISIYALHPIYLGLKQYPIRDKVKMAIFFEKAQQLNTLKFLDYEQVIALKNEYIEELFKDYGKEILSSENFHSFFEKNSYWLFPYVCFTYLRDKYKTAEYKRWGEYSIYDAEKLSNLIETNACARNATEISLFTQYLLHKQLSEAKEYAHQKGMILKGDIPIGISSDSVEAWTEPHLFNLDKQTGAPPDDFSEYGQNWGFPTYKWEEMAKDNYRWWKQRFRKMSDYFDAYRIDHILGFFRIWEIPQSSVQGLLGYFSPALPYSVEELSEWGILFDKCRMAEPYITDELLDELFGEYKNEVADRFLEIADGNRYCLKEEYNTQKKIQQYLIDDNEKTKLFREGLYIICNEVIFVADKNDSNKFHPRISAQKTYSYMQLIDADKEAYDKLYNHFFYERHNEFWRNEAMKKLPVLISSTQMLVCGEDLGMIPECVPEVMRELEILSLEIERMPKQSGEEFSELAKLPYESVCTTSTHDMSPIRLWWTEDRETTQRYYNRVLWKGGDAPKECNADICWQIVLNHLNSPSMLAILPLQDWLSIYNELRTPNPADERINIPSDPKHYWRYRMHITLEELLNNGNFSNVIHQMLTVSGRN